MLPLGDLQLRFLTALNPSGSGDDLRPPASDPALLALVNGGGALGPAARIEIYADMYRSRLIDVLREDCPRVAAILGTAEFAETACRYLTRHPSTHPSVRHVGRHFADFLASQAALPPFLADLARLEWARVEVFDAPDAEPLRLTDLASVAPSQWPGLRLRPIPACRVLASPWPVHEIWAGAEESDPQHDWVPEAAVVRVWREGFDVSHAAMGIAEQCLFPLLERGEPFARLCAALGNDADAEAAAREVGGLLMRWIEDGLLVRVAV